MKRLVLLGCVCAGLSSEAELTGVHTVYLMPMSRGLDQYLANRLTNSHVFQVVTDPKLADAVFTDRIGEALKTQLDNMAPASPAPPATAPPPVDPAAPAAGKDSKAAPEPEAPRNMLMTDTVNKLDNPGLNSTFGRAKGTIFLVDARSRAVLWSVYETPPGSASKEMDRAASTVVERLMKDLGMKKK